MIYKLDQIWNRNLGKKYKYSTRNFRYVSQIRSRLWEKCIILTRGRWTICHGGGDTLSRRTGMLPCMKLHLRSGFQEHLRTFMLGPYTDRCSIWRLWYVFMFCFVEPKQWLYRFGPWQQRQKSTALRELPAQRVHHAVNTEQPKIWSAIRIRNQYVHIPKIWAS